MTRRVESLIMFAGGGFAAIDDCGRQIPELQALSAVELWIQHATAAGYDVRGCAVSVTGATGVIVETCDVLTVKWDKR